MYVAVKVSHNSWFLEEACLALSFNLQRPQSSRELL